MDRGVQLRQKVRKLQIAIGAACVLLAISYGWLVLRHFRAERLRARSDFEPLNQAAQLEAENAETHWLLGRYWLRLAQAPEQALPELNAAVSLDPYAARYWLELAVAYQVSDNAPRERWAVERALQAEPSSPGTAWEVASSYLATGESHRALPLFRIAMANDANMVPAGLALCWRATKDVHQVLREAVPADPKAYLQFLQMLAREKEPEAANQVWSAIKAQQLELIAKDAFGYVDFLIERRDVDRAQQVWSDLRELDPKLKGVPPDSSMITNGSFEGDTFNGGFEWRQEDKNGLAVSIDRRIFHEGARSLRIVFTGPAVDNTGVFQFVPVKGDTAYRLSAFIKADGLVSASGLRIVVEDAYSGETWAAGDEVLGTSDWQEKHLEFRTRPDGRLLVVRVVRRPGTPLIKGTFWMDDVSLLPDTTVAALQP